MKLKSKLGMVTASSMAAIAGIGTGITALVDSPASAAASPNVTIKAVLPPNTGPITSKQNVALNRITQQYEKAHPNVKVQWLPNNYTSIVESNAAIETQAAGGSAPDVIWEQYNPVLSGSIPNGLLQNLKPYLEKPNPYVAGNKQWIDLYTKSTVPYMTAPNGTIPIILSSNVETGFFYSKAAFAKAGISSAPGTWAALVSDMAKLKKSGITPFMFADGSFCNPSWYERLVGTSLLANQISQFDVDHSIVTSGLDIVVGVKKGIISMTNPRYAEGWKLLQSITKYSLSGESSYDACSNPNVTTPPLGPQSLLIQGKVAMLWGGTWYFPQLDSAGFTNKYGVFPEPVITKATTPLALGTKTVGVIGGPNGTGQWSITSQKADSSMTPQKTAVVMNFMAWLETPAHVGAWVNGEDLGDIPTEPAAPVLNIPGMKQLVPSKRVPTVVDTMLDSVIGSAASNSALRLVQAYVGGSDSWSQFSSAWQSLLTSSANSFAQQNHLNVNKYLK
jgi:ABC-type glycerol-3-phosphate transport system substrate-binding protein